MFTIGVLEKYPLTVPFKENVIHTANMSVLDPKDKYYQLYLHHGDNVVKIIVDTINFMLKGFMTQQQIDDSYVLHYRPRTLYSLNYLKNKEVNVINLSSTDMEYLLFTGVYGAEEKLSEECLMLCGSGDEGKGKETTASLRSSWHGVGAVDVNYNLHSYSGWNEDGDVLCCSVTGIKNGVEDKNIYGTSYSSPKATGVISAWSILHEHLFGFYAYKNEMIEWIKRNASNVGKTYNNQYGYGVIDETTPLNMDCFYFDNLKRETTHHFVRENIYGKDDPINYVDGLNPKLVPDNKGIDYQSRFIGGNMLKVSTILW